MELIISFIGVFLISTYFGYWLREQVAITRTKKLLQQFTEQQNAGLTRVKIERVGESLYVYDGETNTFLGQGSNYKELELNLMEKYPGKVFAATEENLKEVGIKHD